MYEKFQTKFQEYVENRIWTQKCNREREHNQICLCGSCDRTRQIIKNIFHALLSSYILTILSRKYLSDQ